MANHRLSVASVFIILILSSCGVSRSTLDNIDARISNEESQILIQAQAISAKDELSKGIGLLLKDTIAEGVYDEYALNYIVKSLGEPTVSAEGRQIGLKLPLKILVDGDLGIAKVNANGQLVVELQSDIEIGADWKLQTRSRLLDHEWLDKPKLKIGFINISAERLADYIIRRIRSDLESIVDDGLRQNVDLPKEVRSLQDRIVQELQYEFEGRWINIVPKALEVAEFSDNGTDIGLQMALRAALHLRDSALHHQDLDTLSYQRVAYDTERLKGRVIFSIREYDVQDMMREYLEHNPIEVSSDKIFTLTQSRLTAQDGKLRFVSESKGYLEGPLHFEVEPEYSPSRNEIVLKDFELKTKIKGLFKRAGLSLAKTKIKNEVEKGLNAMIWEWLDEYNKMVREWATKSSSESPLDWDSQSLQVKIADVKTDKGLIQVLLETKETLRLKFP